MKRDEFIGAANERVTSPPQDTSFESSAYSEPSTSTNLATVLESNTSEDEPSTSTNLAAVLESDTSEDELTSGDRVSGHRSGKHRRRGEPERSRHEYQPS